MNVMRHASERELVSKCTKALNATAVCLGKFLGGFESSEKNNRRRLEDE